MADEVWIGGRVEIGPMEDGQSAAIDVVLDPKAGIVGHRVASRGDEDFGRLVAKSMSSPSVGKPRRPKKVRVASVELATEIKRVLGDLAIEIAPTPELQDVFDGMMELFGGVLEPDESFVGRPWQPDHGKSAARLAASARALWSGAPWKRLEATDTIRVAAPALGCKAAFALVVGQLRENFGFALFASEKDLRDYRRFSENADYERGAELDAAHLMVLLTPPGRGKRSAARAEALHVTRSYEPVEADHHETALLIAVAEALAAFDPGRGSFTHGPVTLSLRTDAEVIPLGVAPVGSSADVPPQPSRKTRWHHVIDRMYPRVLAWAEANVPGWSAHWAAMSHVATPELRMSHALFALATPRGPLAGELYRAAQARPLTDEERRWLDANIATAWTSYWRVVDAVPGRSITLRDILSEEVRTVVEESASKMVVKNDLMLARVVTIDDESYLDIVHPRTLGPQFATSARRHLAESFKLNKVKPVPVDKLRRPDVVIGLILLWEEAIRVQDADEPELRNTDGDPLVMVSERFVLPLARRELKKRLAADPLVTATDSADTWKLCKRGNAMHASWDTTIVATLRIEERTLVCETNSLRRATDARAWLTKVFGAAPRLVDRSERPGEALAREVESRSKAPRAAALSEMPPPEVQTAIVEFKTKNYESWIDMKIPALGDKRPRDAVKTAKGRQQVAALIDEMERMELRGPPIGRYDFDVLRRALRIIG